MTNITIFEPETSSSLFSSQDAMRIAAVMEALEGLENYEALLFNLTDDAEQFGLNKAVSEKIEAEGNTSLPITVVDGKIRFGLLGIKNVGEGVIETIVDGRTKQGAAENIFEFVDHVDIHKINKKAMESLIKAGALDSMNTNRAQHLAMYEGLLESAQNDSKKNIEGQYL